MIVWALIMSPLSVFMLSAAFELTGWQPIAVAVFIGGLFGGMVMLEED